MKRCTPAALATLSCFFATGFAGPAWAEQAADPLAETWHLDQTLYPKVYGILANEHLVCPVDMSDWPVKIDHTRQLFVDDYLLAATENIEREVHQPRRHPANPVLINDRPDKAFSVYMPFVHREDETG